MDTHLRSNQHGSSPHGGFWIRAVARMIDGMLCLFVPTTVAGMVASLTSFALFYPLMFGMLLVYFAGGTILGGTLGERAVSLRVIDTGGERPPRIGQAIVRSIGSTALIVSGIGIVMFGFSDQPDAGYSATDLWIFGALAGLFVLSVLARIWLLVDRDRRTLTDRLAGVTVVRMPAGERGGASGPLTPLMRD